MSKTNNMPKNIEIRMPFGDSEWDALYYDVAFKDILGEDVSFIPLPSGFKFGDTKKQCYKGVESLVYETNKRGLDASKIKGELPGSYDVSVDVTVPGLSELYDQMREKGGSFEDNDDVNRVIIYGEGRFSVFATQKQYENVIKIFYNWLIENDEDFSRIKVSYPSEMDVSPDETISTEEMKEWKRKEKEHDNIYKTVRDRPEELAGPIEFIFAGRVKEHMPIRLSRIWGKPYEKDNNYIIFLADDLYALSRELCLDDDKAYHITGRVFNGFYPQISERVVVTGGADSLLKKLKDVVKSVNNL